MFKRQESFEDYVPMPRTMRKTNTSMMKRFVSEYYCESCKVGYRFFDGECPNCSLPTVIREVEVVDTDGVFGVRMEKTVKGRVDVRDTDQAKDNFLKECVDKAKFKLRRGEIYAPRWHESVRAK